ncbi:maleylpyruvate isomerase N-terminal domain-containing protein [Telmatobacter sp. DSM 110680]|uniref:Maleylpyruvate isomerase N-terminal domain-containing protein n=1 Tax=Telmatobacter sp. DSM 110680 TaxID=3036704 RepID=A0AAU7DFR4_9BACT
MARQTSGLKPILCAPVLHRVDAKLLELLRDLSADEWDIQTVAPAWKVRDVAAHLLDTVLRKLSMVRDGCFVETPEIHEEQEVVKLVNRLNGEGVQVFRRLSSSVLIDMMEMACRQSADFHESLDPFAQATFNVSWAGEPTSLNWFDTARELTERWHHQQQIRFATSRPGIMTPEFYHPVLDCFIRGLPHALRDVDAAKGTTIQLEIEGDCGGTWLIRRVDSNWTFTGSCPSELAALVVIPQQIAWRVFTKGIDRVEALKNSRIEGESALAEHVFNLTAIVG